MTDPLITPDMPDTAATAQFLRRFADLMSNGQNATYLHHAAGLLETLTARVTAAVDEEQLWRYKYETVTRHADALETECEELKHDIDGHVNIATSILSERDALKATLEGRETELYELGAALNRERGELAAKSDAHTKVLVEFRAAFDRECDVLKATAKLRGEERDEIRRSSEHERDGLRAAIKIGEQSLTELGLSLERERAEFQAKLKASYDELDTLHVASCRQSGELQAKVASLESQQTELRSALERVSDLRNQAIKHYDGSDGSVPAKPEPEADANTEYIQPSDRNPVVEEANAVVPKLTLRQARAQFEYLASECILRGDIASQVMCELGAYTMDLALTVGRRTDQSPVGAVALSVLASPGSTAPVIVKPMRV
jgi:hypothetical protein